MNYMKTNYKIFILLTLTFILMTVVGTLTHELGHYSVAKYLGYEASINYKSSTHWNDKLQEYFNSISSKYPNELENNANFPEKAEYEINIKKYDSDNFCILVSGPLQTMMSGTLGFVLLLAYKHKFISTHKVSLTGWALIFIALFWLRQVANLFVAVINFLYRGQTKISGDEMRLAFHLNINIWTIQIFTGLLGVAVLYIVLKILPKSLLPTFLLSGLTGGLLGYYLWLIKFGKYVMP
jgi:hypothetical protein